MWPHVDIDDNDDGNNDDDGDDDNDNDVVGGRWGPKNCYNLSKLEQSKQSCKIIAELLLLKTL